MKKQGSILILLGVLLLIAALGLAVYNMYDEVRANETARGALVQLQEQIVPVTHDYTSPQPTTSLPHYNTPSEMPVARVDENGYIGILTIPSQGLELPILAEWSDKNLKTAPARFQGSVYEGNLIIAGHNYNSHFGRIPDMKLGDLAYFTDVDGNRFTYEMIDLVILGSNALEDLESGDWDLTLFTCTWGGAERITLRFAEQK
jgi:sortase A